MYDRLFNHVLENGGATINADTREHVTRNHGYYVSLPGHEKKMDIIEDEYIFQAYLERHIARARHHNKTEQEVLGSDAHVGLWLNDTAQIVFDLTIWVQSKDYAMHLGREFNQDAIYDVANNQVINLK